MTAHGFTTWLVWSFPLISRRNPFLTFIAVTILGVGLFSTLAWGNYRFASKNPGGNDFLVHWVGAREFIQEGHSPYSDETALKIQNMVYGRAARPDENKFRVAYPLYSLLLFLPFALIRDYTLARAVWMAVLESGLIVLAFLSLRITRWKPKPVFLTMFLLFSVFWYHGLAPVILGSPVILISLGMVGVLLAIRAGQDELAGILLGLITIKPLAAALFIGFIVVWGVFNRRWKMILWLFIVIVMLSAIGLLLIPDWPKQNLREILRYYPSIKMTSLPEALAELMPGVGSRIGAVLSILVGVITLVEWVIARKAHFRGFLWAACFTLTASQWIGIPTDPVNFVVIFPALVLAFSFLVERWRGGGIVVSIITMLLLFIGIWAVYLNNLQIDKPFMQNPILFLPLPFIAFLLLFWVRWWAIKPPSVWYDLLVKERE